MLSTKEDMMTQKVMTAEELNEREIKKRVKAIRMRRAWVAAHEAKIDTLRQELRERLEARGSNWEDADGYARIVTASERVSYETKGLDALIITQPDRYGWLADYRKTTKQSPSLSVK